MGKRGKRQGRGPRGGGRGPAGGAGGGAGGGGGQPGAGLAPRAGGWADLPRDLLEAVARAVPPGDRLCFRLVCRRWAAAGKAVAPGAEEEQLPPGKMTRTSMLDMAASVARAAMMLGVLEGSPSLIESTEVPLAGRLAGLKVSLRFLGFKKFLCAFSANGENLAVLKCARAREFPLDEKTCAFAAKKGHLKVLHWARANGCPCD